MATKFYFHDAATGDTGTLPGATTVENDGSAPDVTASGASTNRAMTETIGASQTSVATTTLANTNGQTAWFRRFLSIPIASQTISAQTITFSTAGSESNGNSQFNGRLGLYVWRPSDGTLVGTLFHIGSGTALVTSEFGTTETALSNTATSTSVTATDGDILVVEIWRDFQPQLMGTAYTNTFFYDGTTEASATSNAGFVNFANTVTFFTAAARVPFYRPYTQLLPQ